MYWTIFQLERYTNTQNQRESVNNQNHKFAKGKGVVANVFADDIGVIDESPYANLSSEQYSQLISLLQHFQLGKIGDGNNAEFQILQVFYLVIHLLILIHFHVVISNQRMAYGY